MATLDNVVDALSNKESTGIGIVGKPDANGYITQIFPNGGISLKTNVTHKAFVRLFSAPNSIQNVKTGINDKFYYNNGTTAKTITIPAGYYQVADYNNYIQNQMFINGDSTTANGNTTYYISIGVNTPTLQISITVSNGYTVYFNLPNNFAANLGFNQIQLGSQAQPYLSPNIPNMFPSDTILLQCDLVSGMYLNGIISTTMEMIPANVPSGWLMVYSPNPVNQWLVNKKKIDSVNIRITDQNNLPILNINEQVKIFISIIQV